MARDREYWKTFWAEKSDPLHSSSDNAYYDRLAAELRLLLPEKFVSFLDIGCGNGVLYQRMGLDKMDYVGIDLSPAMISKFKTDHPKANVQVGDVVSCLPERTFDVVFSHQVMQNVAGPDFVKLLAHNMKQLADGGKIIHGGILWDRCRRSFEMGTFQKAPPARYRRWANTLLIRSGLKIGIGKWYSAEWVKREADRLGLDVLFSGSLLYPYRFHASFTKRASNG
jgi:SAM-dependent methyltransferase